MLEHWLISPAESTTPEARERIMIAFQIRRFRRSPSAQSFPERGDQAAQVWNQSAAIS
jgi:hypothetical protein